MKPLNTKFTQQPPSVPCLQGQSANQRYVRQHRIISVFALIVLVLFAPPIDNASAQTTVADFESLTVPTNGFFNGNIDSSTPTSISDNVDQIGSRPNFGAAETLQLLDVNGARFFNGYTPDFGSYNGAAYSTIQDTTTPGFGNQYASFAGGGSDGSGGVDFGGTYGVIFGSSNPSPAPDFILPYVDLPSQSFVDSIDITNTSYAALALLNGDGPSRRFGDSPGTVVTPGLPRGDFEDLFQVTLTGFDQLGGQGGGGNQTGSVTIDLADFRFDTNAEDVASVLDTWQTFDLAALGEVQSIGFTFFSTDSGGFGFNTPVYVAVDNLTFTTVPEPGTSAGWTIVLLSALLRRRRISKTLS